MGERKPGREEVDRLEAFSGSVGKVGVKWLAQPVKMNWSRSNKAQKSGWCVGAPRWVEIRDVSSYSAWMCKGWRTKLDLGGCKSLDNSHGSTADWTSPESESGRVVWNRRFAGLRFRD